MNPRPTVIYVDDDASVLRGLERTLRQYSDLWNMRFHARAETAIEDLGNSGDAVVVTDWMMPGMDGLQFCKRLREMEQEGLAPYTYVIVLTGRHDTDLVVQALEEGADDFLSKPFHTRELTARIGVGLRIIELQRHLRTANDSLLMLARTDPLTGLGNRRYGSEFLEDNLERVRRNKQDLSLIMIDLDRFKEVNDRYGHGVGDRVLVVTAECVKRVCRKYDAAIRWGGDELLVICPHADNDEAVGIALRIQAEMAGTPLDLGQGEYYHCMASFGTATALSGEDLFPEQMLARTEAVLYEAKAAGHSVVRGART